MVFGLGVATLLTLVFTPAMLALRVWAGHYVLALGRLLERITGGRSSRAAQDLVLRRKARKLAVPEILWDVDAPPAREQAVPPLRAAE